MVGVEPTIPKKLDFKSNAFANFATLTFVDAEGIEPPSVGLQPSVMPLYYTS